MQRQDPLRGASLWSLSSQTLEAGSTTQEATHQPSFDDLGTALDEVTFVVVDLETTGGSPKEDSITEIGAVKVRGGEIQGEFQTLVNPGCEIPPYITVLTGISTAMVIEAPRIEEVLPAFLEFAHGCVLVAHNARFDVSFLKSVTARCGYPWPRFPVVDTLTLARFAVPRGEILNHKLGTLAAHFSATTDPNHRALSDARATVDVLHALLGRLAAFGMTHLEDLNELAHPVPAKTLRKRHLADDLPTDPGVYIFRDPLGAPLYIGTSVNIRRRVRNYFTASEKRGRMREMVDIAVRVDPIVCSTPLEAAIREIRLIGEHKPRYNRKSTRQHKTAWIRLTDEHFPRLSVVGEDRVLGSEPALGPFSSQTRARELVEVILDAFPLRDCTTRLPVQPRAGASACIRHEIASCSAPCVVDIPPVEYSHIANAVAMAITKDPTPILDAGLARLAMLSTSERFEEAAVYRDLLQTLARTFVRNHRLRSVADVAQITAARRTPARGWEIVLIRHGRFCGTAVSKPGNDPMNDVVALETTGETPSAGPGPLHGASPEELDLVVRWLDEPGVRLVHVDGDWVVPVPGPGPFVRQFSFEANSRHDGPVPGTPRAFR